MTDYTWVDDAPVVALPPYEVEGRAKRLIEIYKAWGGGGEGRIVNTDHIAGLIEKKGPQKGASFEYRLAGEPLALMTVNFQTYDYVEIIYLVAHPGTENAGGIMVEYLLNLIERLNDDHGFGLVPNMVKLESLNEDATAAYEALGFTVTKAGMYPDMQLDADASDKWERVGEKWRLKKYKLQRFLATA